MSGISPTALTDEELVRYAYIITATGSLEPSWQHELIARLEKLLDEVPAAV